MTEKWIQYAALINDKIVELMQDELAEELEEGDNATQFFHALSTAAPCMIYGNMTGYKIDFLGFNHLANRLVVQYQGKENES